MIGRHLIKSFSRQQKVIALSSAEAELYACTATSAEILGVQACSRDLGRDLEASIYLDASAALGVIQRRGLGKQRHVRTQSLWLQAANAEKRLKFEKVDGARNPSDLMTKHVPEVLMKRHMAYINAIPETGRADSAPAIGTFAEPEPEPDMHWTVIGEDDYGLQYKLDYLHDELEPEEEQVENENITQGVNSFEANHRDVEPCGECCGERDKRIRWADMDLSPCVRCAEDWTAQRGTPLVTSCCANASPFLSRHNPRDSAKEECGQTGGRQAVGERQRVSASWGDPRGAQACGTA